jgi:hypothetical protein
MRDALFGWYQVRGGSYDAATGRSVVDLEYFPPGWLVWLAMLGRVK